MKRYPKYKPFGNYWISEIPSHWNEQKIKHLFDERVEKGHPDEPLLAATQNQGVILKSDYESRTVEATKDLHLLKFVKEGDFVISLRSFQGGIEYSYCQGIISPAYTIMIPRPEIDSSYFRHLAKSRTFIELLKGCVTGIREGQNINYALLRTYLLPLPPIEEQKIIADYLDKKIEQIDRFISLQKEAISLLKELRQAEITKAVTKGLDENAEMKDSGVEWIGEIPKEWGVSYLKELFSFGRGLPITKDDLKENGIPVISYGQIHSKENIGTKITSNLVRYVDESYLSTNSKSLVKIGDFIFADTSEDLDGCGNAVYVNTNMMLFAGYHTLILKSKVVRDNKYLAYLFKSNLWRIQIRKSVYGVKLYSVTQRIMKEVTILHPSLCEQQDIVSYLDQKCAEIDSAIQNKEALIEKVTEYKTRLISDAVTGKIDVRGEAI